MMRPRTSCRAPTLHCTRRRMRAAIVSWLGDAANGSDFMAREANTQDGKRVVFELPIEARLMAIDGTWQRVCKIYDVSEMSAKLVIDGVLTDIDQREFFLVLSATGLAYRHCELAWVNGE